MSRRAAIAEATEKHPKKQTFNQCQDFCRELNLVFLATKYMWWTRMNVKGRVLVAPVRLSKSPRKGRRAATNVLMVK